MVVDGNALKELSSLENNGRACPVLTLYELYELAHIHHAQHHEPVKADDADHVYPVASIVEPFGTTREAVLLTFLAERNRTAYIWLVVQTADRGRVQWKS